MSQNIVLKKGLNIPIKGEADLIVSKSIAPKLVAVRPDDFKGLLPRLLVKEGDKVLCGSPVIADKKNPNILLCSPVSGIVKELVRGEKRKLLAVVIEADTVQQYFDFGAKDVTKLSADEIRSSLLSSGLWPMLIQRPYGIIADTSICPRDIYVSGFDLSPLAANTEFCYANEVKSIQTAIYALSKLTDGAIHLSLQNGVSTDLERLNGVQFHYFSGKYPASNVGVQIANIKPIQKGETVWTISLLGLAAIGKLFTTGRYNLRRKVAVVGPRAIEASYIETVPGISMNELAPFYGGDSSDVRFVSGNALSGKKDTHLGFYDNIITLLHEGVEQELLGWVRPIRYKQYSRDHSYFSWLTPWRKYNMDTNLHGGKRTFLMNDGYYGKVLPMDIFPIYLTKACLAGDIEKMEKFGIYEVLPEDLAICEFIDPSKNDIQDIIAKGIDLMLKEMA